MKPQLPDVEEIYYPARSMIKFPPGMNPLKYLNDPVIKNRQIAFPPKAAHEKEKENATADQNKTAADREIDDNQKVAADKNAPHNKEKETAATDEKVKL